MTKHTEMHCATFDTLSIGVVVTDVTENHKILFVNSAYLKLTGYSEQELLRDKPLSYVFSDDVKNLMENAKIQLAQTNSIQQDFRLIKKDGTIRWVNIQGKYIAQQGHTPLLIFSIFDITAIKNLQLEFAEKAHTLELINESVPGGIVMLRSNAEFTITYANTGYYKLVGYTQEEIANKFQYSAARLVYPEDLPPAIESLKQQLSVGNKFYIEARVIKKDTSLIWISFIGIFSPEIDNPHLCCVLTDITAQKNILNDLMLERTYTRTILELSDDIIFDYNFATDSISISDNLLHFFDIEKPFIHFTRTILSKKLIYKKDVPLFFDMIKGIRKGILAYSQDLRFNTKENKLRWFRLVYKIITDTEGIPKKTIGRLIDIDMQKKELEILELKTKIDPLTNVYNKIATKELIEKSIHKREHERYALFIIDIDNFKGVNDHLGHQFGDSVLVDIASKISIHFRDSDIVGRVGGDEFVVFLCHVTSLAIVHQKAQELTDAFRQTFTGEQQDYKISGSIGIALYPDHGTDFDTLYKFADTALYESKHVGKDCYTIFSETFIDTERKNERRIDVAEYHITDYYKNDPMYTIFEMLYETKDLHTTINKILQIIGKRYSISRCYIFQNDKKDLFINNTYEWCNEFIQSQIHMLQKLPIKTVSPVYTYYDNDGLFYCNDITKLDATLRAAFEKQNIQSILHCALFDHQNIKGFIGFDECSGKQLWGQEEIASLAYMSKMLSIFLQRKN